jgi:hypothetical protein
MKIKFLDIKREADKKYGESPIRKNLARQAVELGSKWANENAYRNLYGDISQKNTCKKECYQYIKENIDATEAKQKYGSIILIFILGAVISWVVKRILDKLFP